MSSDWTFGSYNQQQLHVRWIVPVWATAWDGRQIRFAPRRVINPMRWLHALASPWTWRDSRVWLVRHPQTNNRCYCPVGSSTECSVIILGWGFFVWWSIYTGPVPCHCDKANANGNT